MVKKCIDFRGFLFLFLLIIFCSNLVSAAKVDTKVLKELREKGNVSVIVVLKSWGGESSPNVKGMVNVLAKNDMRNNVKERIKKDQDDVLSTLKVREQRVMEDSNKAYSVNSYSDEEIDLSLEERFSLINAFSGDLTEKGLDKLEANPLVEGIYFDEVKQIFLSDSVPLINANKVWNISVNGVNINGSGQTVCVIDTGIDYNHTNLGGTFGAKVIGGYDYVNSDNNPMDDHGHGTHVAGIIASTNDTYRGVAPEAKLIAVKVCNAAGSCTDSNVLSGIEWCVSNSSVFNITVISISLGGGQYTSYCDGDVNSQYASLINQAVGRNISVVVATGNTDATFTNATAGIAAPACVRNATRVTATDKNDAMASYAFRHSNFNDLITAPGNSITSLNDGGGVVGNSGTSMATPHVSGAIALMKQYGDRAYGQNLTPSYAASKIRIMGVSISDSGGSGLIIPRIDVLAAIQPYINFTSNSAPNGTTIIINYAVVNVTSDVSLSNALLEWNYLNGTLVNYTMNGSLLNFYYNFTGLVAGNYSYKVYGNDTVGTWGVSATRFLFVDQTAPIINFFRPVNNSYFNQWFYLNVSITDSSLFGVLYNISNSTEQVVQTNSNFTLSGLSSFNFNDLANVSNSSYRDGNYTASVFANDTLGNNAVNLVSFIVDKTLPLLFGANRSLDVVYNNNSVTFFVNVTDTNLNISSVLFESNFSGAMVNYTMIFEAGGIFNYTVAGRSNLTNQRNISYTFHAFDFAGNLNSTKLYSFIVQNRAPYLVNITSHINNSVVEVGALIAYNATAVDDDLDNLMYYWNFSDGRALVSGQNITYYLNNTGNYTILLNISDGYGFNSTLLNIIVNDTLGPILTTSYLTAVHLSGDINQTVTLNVFDYSGISNVTLLFNGSGVLPKDQNGNNYNWTFGGWGVGNYNFTINATDNFTYLHTTVTIYNFSVVSCSDSVQNGDETGTDCGGSCSACSSSSSSSSSSSGGGGGGGAAIATVTEIKLVTPKPAVEISGGGKTIEEVKIVEPVKEEGLEKKSVEAGVSEQKEIGEKEKVAAGKGVSISGRLSALAGKAFGFFKEGEAKTKGLVMVIAVLAVVLFGIVYWFKRRRKGNYF